MPPRLTKGKSVESVNDAAKKVGYVVDRINKGVWMMSPKTKHALAKLVIQTAALSPATKRAARAKKLC